MILRLFSIPFPLFGVPDPNCEYVFAHGTPQAASHISPTPLPLHLPSAAAGNANLPISWNNFSLGVASGVAPGALLAIYKVLWNDGRGTTSDVYAAVDQAVADGVDVISMSLGSTQLSYFRDLAFLNAAKVRRAALCCQAGTRMSASVGDSKPGHTMSSETTLSTCPSQAELAALTISRQGKGC